MQRSSVCWLHTFAPPHQESNPVCPDRASIVSLLLQTPYRLHFAPLRTLNHPVLLCTPPTCKVPYEAAYPSQLERLHRGSLMSMCNIAAALAKDVMQAPRNRAQSQPRSKEQSFGLQFHQAL